MTAPFYVQSLVGQLCRAREDRRLSQSDIARAVGVSKQAVSAWETGRSEPPLSALVAYGRAVGRRLTVLVERDLREAS